MKSSLSAILLLTAALPVLAADDHIQYTPMNRPGHASSHVLYDDNQVKELGRALKQAAIPSGNGINYHGGPVMTNTVTIYYIWYGNWNGNTGVSTLESFAKNLGGSPYYNINTTYTDGGGTPVKNTLIFGGSTVDNYSLGKSLSDAQIWQAVSNAITSGKFPSDPNAVYFLLTSADVDATSGFCKVYCGWHTYNTLNNVPIKYSFVGDGGRCASGCTAQSTKSPNNNVGADGMASVIAHELSETVSDPQLNAWWDNASGGENGDKCAWTFGVTSSATNGSRYNLTLGGNSYLIQQMWLNSGGGGCVMQFVPPVISGITPASGGAGSSVNVTLTGSSFVSGANTAISGVGVTTSNLVVVNPTTITATLNIAANADLGVHNVSIAQGLAVSSPISFTVNANRFSLTKVDPATGAAGATVPVTLTGTNFVSGASVGVSGTGITVSNVKFVSATQITASLAIASAMPPGPYNLTVTQAGAASAPVPFTVTSTAMTLTGITPSSIGAGGSAKVTLLGTNFRSGATVNISGSGVTVSGITVVSPTQITAIFAVAATAAVGPRNVTASFGTNTSQAVTFTANPAPNFTSMSPASGGTGSTTKLTLTGTNFTAGTNVSITGTGVTVSGVTVISPTQLTANLAIDKAAPTGPRSVSLSYGTASSTGATFTVVAAPTLALLTPSSAASGTTSKVTLTGTNFGRGSTIAVDGPGVTVNTPTVVSATQMTANFVVDATAASGARNITVTSGGLTTAPAIFTVTSTSGPTLTAISPANGSNNTMITVTLTGTRFTAGSTVSVSGSGVTALSPKVVSPTQMTALFLINAAAAAGPRNVTVTSGTTTTSAVTFTAGSVANSPTLSKLDKASGAAGSTMTITATGTNFTSGSALVFSGAGITVSNQQLVSPTQITASLAIASTAAAGVRIVTLSNANSSAGTEVTFTVTTGTTSAPTITGLSPAAGVLGTALVTTITGTSFTRDSVIVVADKNIPVLQSSYISPTQMGAVLGLGGTVGVHTMVIASGSSATALTSAPARFSITMPPVASTSGVTPAAGAPGKTLSVTISGVNFTPDMVVNISGSGVTVGNITSAGPTYVTVPLDIATSATLGARTLTVTTPAGVSNTQTFTVNAN